MDCCFAKLPNGGKRLQWNLTDLCNLNCIHCCADKKVFVRRYSEQVVRDTVSAIKHMGVEKVSLSGGEPTINESFQHIVQQLYNANIKVGVITNLFYDLSLIQDSLNYIDSITTSIDGLNEIHNKIRGSDCFSTTVKNIERLVSIKANVKVIYTLQDNNIHCLEETISLLSNIGVKQIMLAHISPRGRGVTNRNLLTFSLTDNELQRIISLATQKNNVNISTSRCGYLSSNPKTCIAGKEIYYLSPDLILYPCHLKTVGGKPLVDVKFDIS